MDASYRVTVKVRNARLLRALECIGSTPSGFAKANGLSMTRMCSIVAMKEPPVDAKGEWRPEIIALCEAANVMPSDLFTARQMEAFENTTSEKDVDEVEMLAISGVAPSSEDVALISDARNVINGAIEKLPERSQAVLKMRMDGKTLDECGKLTGGIGKERVRQIEKKAIRDLRKYLKNDEAALTSIDWASVE